MNKVYEENSTGNAPYRVLLSASYDDTSKDDTTKKSSKLNFNPATGRLDHQGDLYINKQDGTSSAVGESAVVLGNSTAAGSAGNSKGSLYMYANTSKYIEVLPKDGLTNDRVIRLPDAAGTVLLEETLNYVEINSTNFNYDSSNKYFYSKKTVDNYTTKTVLGVLEVWPTSYGASVLQGYLSVNGTIGVTGWVPASGQPIGSTETFVVRLLCRG